MSEDFSATIINLKQQIQQLDITIEHNKAEYIMLLNRLANMYHQAAQHDEQHQNLLQALKTLQEALRYCESRRFPNMYAILNVNLGNIYVELSELENTHHNLLKALDAYQETLLNTNPNVPNATYATMQNNLGNVCRRLAQFEDRDRNLQRALTAYKEALKFFRPETAPLAYATLQANIGIVQSDLGDLAQAAQAWRAAADVAAHVGALEEAQYFYQLAQQVENGDHPDAS